jgi:hypothetical protein
MGLCDHQGMDNFHSGFALELVGIMSKEAAAAEATSKAEKLRAAAATPEGRKLIAHAKRGGRSVAVGTLAHKLINPGSETGTAVRSGVGMAGGGAIGTNLARQLGFKGTRGMLAGSFLGSALGIRAMRKGKKKKSDRELLEMALKKDKK